MKILFRLFFLLVTCVNSYSFSAPIDLNEMTQDFVLEMKQIKIPGYQHALNPSIIRWNGRLLLCFRIRNPLTTVADGVGLVWLDEKFNPVSTPQVLQIYNPFRTPYPQDPKLVAVGQTLYLVYSDLLNKESEGEFRRMFLSELRQSKHGFTALYPRVLLNFEGQNPNRREKNWVPFDYFGNLLLAYSINPHIIFQFMRENNNECEIVGSAQGDINWHWGELRGGTPALKVKDNYLAFFHSSKAMKSIQSNNKMASHYFMGAYQFSGHSPFELIAMSPEPIIGSEFYNPPEYPTWKPLRVVFPGGYVHDDHFIWVVYGRQDHEMWVVKLDKRKLLGSLVPVSTDKEKEKCAY